MEFSCKEEAIIWICSTQLKRKNITEEAMKISETMTFMSALKGKTRWISSTAMMKNNQVCSCDEQEHFGVVA
ncbi:MAG: hypothetical protein IKJ10_02185 [Bacteroidaceae bacterium]|nr:hypothetical protein [Bacteroidaceae bacterium]